MRTATRIAHYSIGVGAIVVGACDFTDFLVHGGVMTTLGPHDVLLHGMVHTGTAYLALPRFAYARTKNVPFNLWFKTAREANMWPSFLLNTWYTAACASDFVRCENALIHTTDAWFLGFTTLTSVALLYGVARTIREEGTEMSGVFATRSANVLQVLWTMGIPVMADTGKCLLVSLDSGIHADYVALIAAYPAYTQIMYGTFLAAMFLGNVACALSSAEHHGAISKERIGDVSNALTFLSNAAAIYAICSIDDGALARGMIAVTWRGAIGLF
jgi:hypothetical protein